MRMQFEGIKKKMLKIVIKIQWSRWNKIGRNFMVAEATWCFIVPFSLLLHVFKIFHNKNERFFKSAVISAQVWTTSYLEICFVSICFFSHIKKWLSGGLISKAHSILMFLSFHCFVKIWKLLALEFQGLTINYAQVKWIHFSFRLLCGHLSVIFPSYLSVDGI